LFELLRKFLSFISSAAVYANSDENQSSNDTTDDYSDIYRGRFRARDRGRNNLFILFHFIS
jgi:hypothetical protein